METAEENKSNDQFLSVYSFTQKELENIYNSSKTRSEKYGNLKLEYLEKEDNNFVTVLLALKDESWKKFHFYKTPATLLLENVLHKIYTTEQCFSVISQFNLEQYSIIVNDEEIKNKQINRESLKTIVIKKLKSKIEKEEFIQYIVRIKPNLPLAKSIMKLDKKKLSFYFDDICISSELSKTFVEFILESNRNEFIDKINYFI